MNLNIFVALISLAVLITDIALVEGRFFCFRRLKKKNKCGGLLRKDRYTDAESCCKGRGQGFADKKLKLGRNRFRCIPCPENISRTFGNRGRGRNTAAKSHTRSSTTTPATTTAFSWPVPARRDYKVAPAYDLPKDDDGQLIVWEEWSPCSVSCGAGWRSRAKVCDNCDRNDYENVQSQPCMINFYCPVDGNWGPWYPWESCSTTCNSGTRTRQRKCNYPPPAYGGLFCPGDAVATQECNKKPCPVDGNWGKWTEFSECSSTCGPGTARRSRQCDSPLPQFGGKNCRGPHISTKRCEVIKCPVDGGWSLWGSWSPCTASCGRGVREKKRFCDSPRPQHRGKDCEGVATQQEECYGSRPCPVHGNWGPWGNFGFCQAPRCGQGYMMRTRSCSDPAPAYGGNKCQGQQYEESPCYNDHNCPRNGTWCEWSPWNPCTSSCREDGALQGRQRICACPSPMNGGTDCQGDSFQVQECKDIPYCNTPEPVESSGDGATYDEESEQENTSNTKEPMTSADNGEKGQDKDSEMNHVNSDDSTTVTPP